MHRFTRIILALAVAMSVMLFASPQVSTARADTMQTYIVLYKQEKAVAGIANVVTKAGGTLVYTYDAIGVAIAKSDNPSFRASLLKDSRIENAAATTGFGIKLGDDLNDGAEAEVVASTALASSSSEPLAGLQWDMVQIHAPEAQAINPGSQSVVVGDLDTGLDYTHPDLAANVDFANSVSCESGVPNQDPAAWFDNNGHGTHTAGTIAAAANGIGIVGVAPNVKIAGIKTSNDDGFFFPEMVICAFMWAGDHGIDVTNNSYFADPWLFNCRNDKEQHAIWKAEQRAIRYAMSQGVVVVAAEGNFADDLAHPTQDIISPDFPPGSEQEREVRNSCVVIPVEIPGVVGVTANGNRLLKSFYSSYGVGVTQVIAPGGDSILQRTTAAPNGRVLSTWPDSLFLITCAPARRVVDPSGAKYCYQQGTSMASPHVAGVAALIVSQGTASPGAVAAKINNTADPMACPDTSIYAPFPSVSNGAPQVCQGGTGYNSFNGHGQVNALNAVTR